MAAKGALDVLGERLERSYLALDGIYVREGPDGALGFHTLPAPTRADVTEVARRKAAGYHSRPLAHRDRRFEVLVHSASLSQTVNATSSMLFENHEISAAERTRVARWIAGRQGLPGAYADTFAGFAAERKAGILLFTGERITSASARHILGEEACRVLRLLRVKDSAVKAALDRACEGIMGCLERAALDPRNQNPGRYCCGKCSVGLWRNLLAGGLDRQEERLRKGVRHLRSTRSADGQWRRFPFWYTVLALSEVDLPEASSELKYAAPLLERAAKRAPAATVYARRRHTLAIRALERV